MYDNGSDQIVQLFSVSNAVWFSAIELIVLIKY